MFRNTFSTVAGLVTSSAEPATFASPFQPGGSSEALCKANRPSRRRSLALTDCHIAPNHRSPWTKNASIPLMRGEPSLRSVAIVLWTCASRKA
jgi:hypothetical protein